MTTEEKLKIKNLRQLGHSYGEIATILSISQNTVKSYCRRSSINIETKAEVAAGKCQYCGKQVESGTKGHPRKFCSEVCRRSWWKENGSQSVKKAYYILVCKECGKTFESYGNKTRKFCSHACYIKNRFEKGRSDDTHTA